MENNFRTLISGILAKVSALYSKKSDVYTKQETDSKIKSSIPSVPTKLTQLTNDAGFITADDIPEGGVTSWNDLTDKPFGSEFKYTELASATGVVDTYNTDTLTALFQATLDFVPVHGKTYKLIATDGVQTIEAVQICTIINIPAMNIYSVAIGMSITDSVPIRISGNIGTTWTIHFLAATEAGAEWTITVYEQLENIKPLDGKYLPDGIPFVASASIGQGIMVKAVEGNKPTEFEAVNLVKSYNDLADVPVKEVITTLMSERTVTYNQLSSQSIGKYGINGCNLVSFDGEKYKVQEDYNGMEWFYGNRYLEYTWYPDNGLPFLLRRLATGEVLLSVKDIGIHTISAYKQELIHLDEKFIPDTIARTKDIPNYDSLINDVISKLPIYDGEVIVE